MAPPGDCALSLSTRMVNREYDARGSVCHEA
jgi:hypothetical protein